MKRSFSFVIGASMIIGMIDLATEQVVLATVFNPLDPTEEVVPIDQAENIPEAENESIDTEVSEPEKEVYPSSSLPDNTLLENALSFSDDGLFGKKVYKKKVTLEDFFLSDQLIVNIESNEINFGGDDDESSYLSSLCYLLSGNVLYGQKKEGGLKVHVCDIFE